MQVRRVVLRSLSLALALVVFGASAYADDLSAVFVYGDSLSDNGNLHSHVGLPDPPYYQGRFSNGPVTVEQLAATLNVPLYDFAWAGATTGIGNSLDSGTQTAIGFLSLPGMLTQLAGYTVPPALIPTSLFVVWGGANDFEINASPLVAAADIVNIVTTLQSEGAKNILVPGLPDLGLTPEFYGDPAATAFTDQFNAALQASLPAGTTYFDVNALLNQIVANPGAYGFTNVTDPCFNGTTVCANPDQYLYWDDIHPTTAADAILAANFRSAVTPEPSSIVLLGSGIAGITGTLLRRRKSRRNPLECQN